MSSERNVDVIHALVAQRRQGGLSLFFVPHNRWGSPDEGRPVLAVPVKKVPERSRRRDLVSLRGAHRALAAVWHEDLGFAGAHPAGRRLPLASLRLNSPTFGVPTTYRIAPLAVTLAAGHDELAARTGGLWLTPSQALARQELSPTVRQVLAPLAGLSGDEAALLLLGADGPADEWTRRLAEARWDVSRFGDLFEEMRQRLAERLRMDVKTRPLFAEPDEVDDALNEGAANALGGLASFDPGRGTAEGWLWAVVRNAAVNLLRERRRHGGVRVGCEEALLGAAGSWENPALLAEGSEAAEALLQRLEAMLAREREGVRRAWRMVVEQGQTYKEASEATGVPLGTLAARFFHVRRAVLGE
jgi:RNA polymerase sigma-70 factor (ECF subfamily)